MRLRYLTQFTACLAAIALCAAFASCDDAAATAGADAETPQVNVTPPPNVAQSKPTLPPATQPQQDAPKKPILPRAFAVASISPESGTIDCGRVSPNDLAHGVFTLTNRTASPLEIDRVHITCNCTRALPRQDVIPPRGEVVIDMYIDLRGETGPFEKQAHVYFKNFPNAPADLRLIGDFQFAVAADPGRPKVDSRSKTGQIELVSLDGKPFKMLSVDGMAPVITSQTPPDAERVTKCTIAYDFRNRATVPAALLIVTDREDVPLIPLKIRGYPTAQLERQFVRQLKKLAFSRRFLNLGVLELGKPVSFDMTVFREVADHNQPIEIYFGRDDLEVTLDTITEEANASMFEKAQRSEFTVVSNISARGELILTPLFMKFRPADGGPMVTQRVWAAGITAGQHLPRTSPVMPITGPY